MTKQVWQGRHDSNMQPTVLETATLPLSYSPKLLKLLNYIISFLFSQLFSEIYS